jgi:hypothetical protein
MVLPRSRHGRFVVASWTDDGLPTVARRVRHGCQEVASRHWRQPRPEHQLVAEHVDRVGLPRPGVTGEPPLAALPVGDLRWVLAEYHPVEALRAYVGIVAQKSRRSYGVADRLQDASQDATFPGRVSGCGFRRCRTLNGCSAGANRMLSGC